MPPIKRNNKSHSKQEAVKILSKEIMQLRERGYSLDQIAEALKGEGLIISTTTLKNYLQRAKSANSKTKKSSVKKPAEGEIKKPASSIKGTFSPRPDTDEI